MLRHGLPVAGQQVSLAEGTSPWYVPSKAKTGEIMSHVKLPTLPTTQEAIDLVEQHQQLIATYALQVAPETDSYSLAQPSPYRFVPSIASNRTGLVTEGE